MLEIIPDMGKTNTLEHNTRHLPRSAYHIGYVDLMLDEVIKRFPKWSKNEEIRSAMLKSIQKSLIEAIDTFAKDKYAYGKIERQGFSQRKYTVDQKLKALKKEHEKMLSRSLKQ